MSVERGSDRMATRGRENTREQRRDASRYVLKRARNKEDLHLLMEALGLNTPASKEA
ncbi:hypothetical protein [Streptomyces sp. NPDC093676]|uniref:hypothetical protein n=1 Tax=Streptomyces sp. NPDC093676 TaxID=3366050 RepID=UPI0038211184